MLDHSYLKQLEKPIYAVTPQLWNEWVKNLKEAAEKNETFQKILSQRVNFIAKALGVEWRNEKDEHLTTIIERSFDEIKNRKYIGEWYKNSLMLTVSSLVEMNEQKWDALTQMLEERKTASTSEDKTPEDKQRTARIAIDKALVNARKDLTDDNYESNMTDLIKTILKNCIYAGTFQTPNLQRYVEVFKKRIVNGESYSKIAEDLEMNQTQVNGIIQKFVSTFQEMYEDDEQFRMVCKRIQALFDAAFEVLDDSNLETRNNRIQIIRNIQETLIAKNLADYIE